MNQDFTCREKIQLGMSVDINPQKDRSRHIIVSGIVEEILTNSPYHTHGILVKLDNGEVGRVKKINEFTLVPRKTERQPNGDSSHELNRDLGLLISAGENHFVEFKSSILWSTRFSDQQINESFSPDLKKFGRAGSKFIIAKSIAGFLNADGGDLIIGVKENKSDIKDEIIGVESEFYKLTDQCVDGYRRMILDQIVKDFFGKDIFHHINDYVKIYFKNIENKTVCHLSISKSDRKVFVNFNKVGHFFVRIDATTRELNGEEIVDFCLRRFA